MMMYSSELNTTNPSSKQMSLLESLRPIYSCSYKGQEYRINCPSEVIRWRAETYFTKEPDTIGWIESFNPGEVLLDIGANIGLYTVFAASKGIRVIACEPESQNFSELNINVHLNNVGDKVDCLSIALSDQNKVDDLYIPTFGKGFALSNLGIPEDWKKETFSPQHIQKTITYSIDSFLDFHPEFFPNHIKIDVDGHESTLFEGGEQTFSDSRVKSVLIELNEDLSEDMAIVDKLISYEFKLKSRYHHPMFDNGDYSSIYNYIFLRN